MEAEKRICVVCGKEYITTRVNAKYCSDACQTKGLRLRQRKNDQAKNERKREERVNRKKRQKALIDIAVEAKNAGMSYGQYVARMGL